MKCCGVCCSKIYKQITYRRKLYHRQKILWLFFICSETIGMFGCSTATLTLVLMIDVAEMFVCNPFTQTYLARYIPSQSLPWMRIIFSQTKQSELLWVIIIVTFSQWLQRYRPLYYSLVLSILNRIECTSLV